jgi:hypothetical protein
VYIVCHRRGETGCAELRCHEICWRHGFADVHSHREGASRFRVASPNTYLQEVALNECNEFH